MENVHGWEVESVLGNRDVRMGEVRGCNGKKGETENRGGALYLGFN